MKLLIKYYFVVFETLWNLWSKFQSFAFWIKYCIEHSKIKSAKYCIAHTWNWIFVDLQKINYFQFHEIGKSYKLMNNFNRKSVAPINILLITFIFNVSIGRKKNLSIHIYKLSIFYNLNTVFRHPDSRWKNKF